MKIITPTKLADILELHKLWVMNESNGQFADLSGANLIRADLRRADLSDADLRRADLSDADLSGADLSDADLSDANLRRADLSGANLRRADLRRADLSDADLSGADLRGADLSGANLIRANLSGANLAMTRGLQVASCHWTGHGECGRLINAVQVEEEVRFFCGCFEGNEQELRDYIAAHNPEHISSRTKALEFLLSCF